MEDCIFCKIVKGEVPSYKVYEDDNFLAFLDNFPAAAGHTLLIPKKHYRWIWDMEKNEYTDLMERAQKIAISLRKAFGSEFISGAIIGVDVTHAHVHLLPNELTPTGSKLSPKPTPEEFSQMSEKIRKFI